MATMTFADMMKISIAMPILLILSFIVVGQALERVFAYMVVLRMPEKLWASVSARLDASDKLGAIALARQNSGIMPTAFTALLMSEKTEPEAIAEAFQVHRQRLSMALNRRVGLFGTASFISPLIGLMGTVLGIMRAFHDLAASGAGGPAVVAAGISEALVATAFGIGLAVFSAVLYNYFTMESRYRLNTADLWVMELADKLKGNG